MNPEDEIDLLQGDDYSKIYPDRTALLIKALAAVRANPSPAPQSPSNRSSTERVLERKSLTQSIVFSFQKALQDRDGECFRTEIRTTGVFVCGIHHQSIWELEGEDCPAIAGTIEALGTVVAESLRGWEIKPSAATRLNQLVAYD